MYIGVNAHTYIFYPKPQIKAKYGWSRTFIYLNII